MLNTKVIGSHPTVILRSRSASEEGEQAIDFLHCTTCDALSINEVEMEAKPCNR